MVTFQSASILFRTKRYGPTSPKAVAVPDAGRPLTFSRSI
jgi:hypothetical protein